MKLISNLIEGHRKRQIAHHKPKSMTFHDSPFPELKMQVHRVTKRGEWVLWKHKEYLSDLLIFIRKTFPKPNKLRNKFAYNGIVLEKIDMFKDIFKLTLPDGEKFVMKIGGPKVENAYGNEIDACHKARAAGLNTVEHYAQFSDPDSHYYYVLMEYKDLPTVSSFSDNSTGKNHPNREEVYNLYNKESNILQREEIGEANPDNVFAEKTRKGYKLSWFDLQFTKAKK